MEQTPLLTWIAQPTETRRPTGRFLLQEASIIMAFISHFRTQILSWWQDTPLPAGAAATFQSWHEFDEVGNRWRAVEKGREIVRWLPPQTTATDRERPTGHTAL